MYRKQTQPHAHRQALRNTYVNTHMLIHTHTHMLITYLEPLDVFTTNVNLKNVYNRNSACKTESLNS